VLLPLLVALTLVEPSTSVDVPYLPQTEALCGGAAAAMVFRYWGERYADVQQFEPLVDRRAGGIATNVLADAVRQRGWRVSQLEGSPARLREHLAREQPLIVLLQDRPGRLHYVVAVGITEAGVLVHDPTWGPRRQVPLTKFVEGWKASGYWTLLVLPDPSRQAIISPTIKSAGTVAEPVPGSTPPAGTRCQHLLDEALDEIERSGLGAAEAALASVRLRCPDEAGPLRELSGVRFSEGRFAEAEGLAEGALARDPRDTYAWDVLASSRFMQDDVHGALSAWNRIDRPRLDSVQIGGLARTRYALVAQALGLGANEIVTERGYRLAERRLHDLPVRSESRMGLRPAADGFATVDVAIVERAGLPGTGIEWAAAGLRTAATREVEASIPGPSGQGEVWEASWRWWARRPRLAGSFIAPRIGRLPGVWRVDAQWDEQTYTQGSSAAAVREARLGGGISTANWMTPSLRLEVGAMLDSWNHTRRTVSFGGALDRRFAGDRVAVSGTARAFVPLEGNGSAFRSMAVNASVRTSHDVRRWVQRIDAGIEDVTRDAPLALWPGAGEGHARRPLARAHPLLDDGVVTGPIFGRRLGTISADTERWLARPSLVRIGIAGFVDVARAAARAPGWDGDPLQVDAGVGLRLRLPGHEGTLRVDFGRGLRDGRQAVTVGWQP
jgi:hypothetical protein